MTAAAAEEDIDDSIKRKRLAHFAKEVAINSLVVARLFELCRKLSCILQSEVISLVIKARSKGIFVRKGYVWVI